MAKKLPKYKKGMSEIDMRAYSFRSKMFGTEGRDATRAELKAFKKLARKYK